MKKYEREIHKSVFYYMKSAHSRQLEEEKEA